MHLLFGEVTAEKAETVVRAAQDGSLKELGVCSNGGDLLAALAVYDAIVEHNVTTVGIGYVASAGVLIYLAGSKRLASPHTRFMTHSVGIEKSKDDGPTTAAEATELAELQEMLAKITSERTGLTEEMSRTLFEAERNFNVKRAIELGFVHECTRL